MARKYPMKAEDVIAQLHQNPEWVRRREEREKQRTKNEEKLRKAQTILLLELSSIGIKLSSIYDLVNSKQRYDAAIPILLTHLTANYPDRVREGIARSLGRPWARKVAWHPVLDAYRREPNKSRTASQGAVGAPSGPKDGLAAALSEMANPDDLSQIIDLISDPSNGPSRMFFIRNLARSRSRRAFEALAKLSNDPDLKKEIEVCLRGKLKVAHRNSTSSS